MGLAIANNNPGNIKDPATGSFRSFKTPQEGYAALLNDLQAKQTGTTTTGLGPSSTLVDFASTYAPATDKNKPGQYAATLANQLGVRPDSQLKDLDLAKWASAVAQNEDKDSPFAGAKVTQSPKQQQEMFPPEQQGNQAVGKPQDLFSDVSDVASKAGAGASSALSRTLSGQINPLSGLIQGVGSLAGGVGGLIDAGISHTPVIGDAYKGLTKGLGSVIGAAANTGVGQTIMSGYKSLPEELRGDIEGAVNIASLVPLGKGLTLGKAAVEDSLTAATKGGLKKAAESELKSSITTQAGVKGLVKAEARGLKPTKLISENKDFLPEVINQDGKFIYNSNKGTQALNSSLDVDETKLQDLLKTAVKKNVGVDLEQVRARTLKDVAKEYGMSGNYRSAKQAVNDYFDSFLESTGGRKIIDLNELNGLKRDVRGSVFNLAGDVKGSLSADIKYQMGQSVMKQVEEIAKGVGVKGVDSLNKIMGEKLEALKILKQINGKSVPNKNGIVREGTKAAAGVAGEVAGNAIGVPLAGTFAGRGLAGLVGRQAPKTAIRRLRKSSPPLTTLRKAGTNTATGLAAQGAASKASEK